MKRYLVLISCLVLSVGFLAGEAKAEGEDKPVQLSLFNPIQIFGEETSIKGLRLNLIYGRNVDVTGIDLGLVNHATGDFSGVQWGAFNYVEGDGAGWQYGYIASIAQGEFTGLQTGGIFNSAETGTVFQLGLINIADDISGFQFGLFNMTENLDGLQIGLINVISSKEKFSVLPIVNWKF